MSLDNSVLGMVSLTLLGNFKSKEHLQPTKSGFLLLYSGFLSLEG